MYRRTSHSQDNSISIRILTSIKNLPIVLLANGADAHQCGCHFCVENYGGIGELKEGEWRGRVSGPVCVTLANLLAIEICDGERQVDF